MACSSPVERHLPFDVLRLYTYAARRRLRHCSLAMHTGVHHVTFNLSLPARQEAGLHPIPQTAHSLHRDP